MTTISLQFDVDDKTVRTILALLVGAEPPPAEPLQRLLRADLNDVERQVLRRLADAAPAVVPHEELLALCGSGPKYGNVMSGLRRRWLSRVGGADLPSPWSDDGSGYHVSLSVAADILAALETNAARRPRGDQASPNEAEWAQYEDRYRARPATFAAYVDVWTRVPGVSEEFGGWASFSQAANKEPAQRPDRVRLAEEFMRVGGYELGPSTPHGGRQWQKR